MRFVKTLLCTTLLTTTTYASPIPQDTPDYPESQSGWATPDDQALVPQHNDIVPQTQDVVPQNQDLVPQRQDLVPQPNLVPQSPPIQSKDDPPPYTPSNKPSPLATIAVLTTGTIFLLLSGIGISEWALDWYSRIQKDRVAREKRLQVLREERARRRKEHGRRERAMELVLEMAENHSERVARDRGFDGEFEPYLVPEGVRGAVESVFAGTEGEEEEGLEDLKIALKPILKFEEGERG
jgi:hypothetical protein